MASDITLSKGVRSNLLSLQSTAELLNRTQERLSTGKKVNSALDNPINFFTSAGLSSRANDLSRLLDSVGNAVQTIAAADKGITAITKLIESAQATARQALTAGEGVSTYSLSQTGGVPLSVDVAGVTGAEPFTLGDFAAEAQASLVFDFGSAGNFNTTFAEGEQLTISINGADYNFIRQAQGGGGSDNGDDYYFDDGGTPADAMAAFAAKLTSVFGANADVDLTGAVLTITAAGANEGENFTFDLDTTSIVGGNVDNNPYVAPSKVTVGDGTNTKEFTFVGSGASAAAGTFSNLAGLVSAINHANSNLDVTASPDSGALRIVGNNAGVAISVSTEAVGGDGLGFSGTYTSSNSAYNAQIAGFTGQLSFKLGDGSVQTVELGNGATGEITTRAGLEARLASISETMEGVTIGLTNNRISVNSTSGDNFTIGGAAAQVGLTANTYSPTESFTANSTRASLQQDFNNLLSQITTLAQDASYNGINLLNGDNLSVIFNEDGSSSLSINGVDFSAVGLGLTTVNGSGFQTNAAVNASLAQLDSASGLLRTQSSRFGSNLSIVQTRQDFTKNLISVLQTGADNLVLADTNEEGANMLALQTRQQLSSVALSLASQADQNVLRLF